MGTSNLNLTKPKIYITKFSGGSEAIWMRPPLIESCYEYIHCREGGEFKSQPQTASQQALSGQDRRTKRSGCLHGVGMLMLSGQPSPE